jgi:hypothetical protein
MSRPFTSRGGTGHEYDHQAPGVSRANCAPVYPQKQSSCTFDFRLSKAGDWRSEPLSACSRYISTSVRRSSSSFGVCRLCRGCFASVQPLKPESPGPKWPAWNSSDQFMPIQPSSMDVFTDLAQYPIRWEETKTGSSPEPPDFPLGICCKVVLGKMSLFACIVRFGW